ncbi:glycosyltransferase family 39 protein [Pseudonocardia humida]|uniref:Glycosyltransferase family 39 protein n=1 Tax=Pseudonocardia humida TaxID=2800819 RepID=A0ABT1A501_9PSEU|nr:glycosyltransferase family 39 protein [Pseudonocardia humida]MCO1658089.1 glycosyltransferase family 39 protein [Pseudonocardia humida]
MDELPGGSPAQRPGDTATVVIVPHQPPRSTRRATLLLVGAITLVGLVLRFTLIGSKSLWLDESFSVWIANLDPGQIWRTTLQIDTHPPLYYSLLHFWIDPLSGEIALRSFSALFSAAAVPVLYLVGREVGGRGLGLLVAGLQAVSPLHVWYAQQGRMYAMMTFFAAVALLCMVRLLTGGRGVRATLLTWAGFVVATVLTMLSHNTGVLLPATLVVFTAVVALGRVVAERRRGFDPDGTAPLGRLGAVSRPGTDLRLWLAGLVAVAVLWLPWLPGFAAQTGRVDAEFWIAPPTARTVLDHFRDLLSAYAPGAVTVPLLVGCAVLVGLAAWHLRHRPELLVLLVLLVVGPVVGELLVSVRRPIFYSQTLIWTSLPLTLLLGIGLLRLRPRPVLAAATAALLAVNALSLVTYYRAGGVEDWRGAALYVADRAGPGDALLFSAGWTELAFAYYYRSTGGEPVEMHGLPVDPFDRGVLEPKMAPTDIPRLDQLTEGRPRVWLVLSHDGYTDPDRIVTSRLGEHLRVVEQVDLAGMRIQAYEPD